MVSKMKSAPLSAEIADRLLDLLSTDDAFRSQFCADPRAALMALGYASPEPGRMTACGAVAAAVPETLIDCKVNELAPKEAIANAREEIRAMLTQGLSQTTPKLDANQGDQKFSLR